MDTTAMEKSGIQNQDDWLPKIDRNKARDVRNIAVLETLGWRVIVIWECETKRLEQLASKLFNFLDND